MLDANLLLRTAAVADLTASVTGSFVDFGDSGVAGLSFMVMVPQDSAADTLDIEIQGSTDGVAANEDQFQILPQITAKGVYRITITHSARWWRYDAVVGGAAINWGRVVIGPTFGGDYLKY